MEHLKLTPNSAYKQDQSRHYKSPGRVKPGCGDALFFLVDPICGVASGIMARARSFFCHPVSVIYFDDREEFLVQSREDNWVFKVGRDLKQVVTALERKVERTGNNHGSLRALNQIKAAGNQSGWDIHHIAVLFPQSPPKEYWL